MSPWRRHDGRGMPCDPDAMVHFGIRASPKSRAVIPEPVRASGLRWEHDGGPGDLTWWRTM